MIHAIKGVAQGYTAMAISPDSKLIAAVAADNHLLVFDLEAGVHLDQFKGKFGRPTLISFLDNDRLLIGRPSTEILFSAQISLLDARTAMVLRVFQPGNWLGRSHQLAIFQPLDCIALIDRKICEIWDLKTGTLKRKFEVPEEAENVQLLPCKAHFRIDENLYPLPNRQILFPLSIPDLSNCCSDLISFENFWIKRGDERLVFIPQDYASNLITVRSNRAIFHPFAGYFWTRLAASKALDTLDFDFSMDEPFV